jgi:hypothetical protein
LLATFIAAGGHAAPAAHAAPARGPEAPKAPTEPVPPRAPAVPGPPGAAAVGKEKAPKPAPVAEKDAAELPGAASGAPGAEAEEKGPEPKGRGKAGARRGGTRLGEPSEKSEALPPSIGAGAFRGEVARGRAEGREGPDGQHGRDGGKGPPRSERERLEELAAEIARAREALRQDTARLEAMLQKPRPGRGAGDGAGAAGEGGDAKLPIGEPLRPSAAPEPPREPFKGQIDAVSRAMKGMKPEQAAAIVARLDRTLGAEILRRMPSADAGAVMGHLKPELAADLATEMATRPPVGAKADTKEAR